ncbi:RNA polymerase sigma factor [Chitinophaga cymbidii]|uniref:DNA-directed RNA polymerase sigma-70 factor n=1 Tax=Chitinophaga cymbidii TaxID=1096750 RepID=A0A512RG38_9BACT|nr:RNA polymerase sigma-70 factor [Chitinophaga cymbidii]GEP94662.1 DNA-directed RNA polymerase sigma-70 factor [Chitinophaga cymbidii]
MELSDLELILLWQKGEELAFEVIYKRYAVQLLSIAYRKVGERDIAEDIVQEVFITLLRNKNSANTITSLFAYLYVTLKNKILDAYRRDVVQKKYVQQVNLRFEEEDNSPYFQIETRDLEKKLESEIEKLPPQCGKVFRLSRQKHLSNKEIALQLGISENTVEQHMRKALRILRGNLLYYEKSIMLLIIMLYEHLQ